VSTKTLISIAEFDRLEPPDELRYELDEGELIEMVKPRYQPHNRIVMKIPTHCSPIWTGTPSARS
jgi:Uma2 family endonuclease